MRILLVLLGAALSAPLRAGPNGGTLFVEDFASGGVGWSAVATPVSFWHVTSAGECGLPAGVATTADPSCSYGAGSFYHADFVGPSFLLDGPPPYRVCVDAWIELDPSQPGPDGASVWLVEDTGAPGPLEEYVLAFVSANNSAGFVHACGELPSGAAWSGRRARLRLNLQSDGLDGPGRGFMVDRVEVRNASLGRASCAGTAALCPCANGGSGGAGCDNAGTTGGVHLEALALAPGPAGGTLLLRASGFPPGGATVAVVLSSAGLHAPAPFGDGILCVQGSGARFVAPMHAAAGATTHRVDEPGAGFTRHYQVLYRSAPAAYCTPSAFNASDALSVAW
jgi:hypothetical protein